MLWFYCFASLGLLTSAALDLPGSAPSLPANSSAPEEDPDFDEEPPMDKEDIIEMQQAIERIENKNARRDAITEYPPVEVEVYVHVVTRAEEGQRNVEVRSSARQKLQYLYLKRRLIRTKPLIARSRRSTKRTNRQI